MDSRVERVLTFLLDTIFPPSPEARLVRSLTEAELRLWYLPEEVHGVVALTPFTSPTIRALIHETKFEGNMRGATLLSVLMHEHILRHPDLAHARFVPVPLSPARLRARGYNQVTRVLTALHEKCPSISIDEALLRRTKNTQPQTELGKEKRLTNMKGAFTWTGITPNKSDTIVLVDDVTTTGATLREARDTLRRYISNPIVMISLAH